MNTTAKGTDFELRVLTALKLLMLNGDFITNLSGTEIFHRKPYYSAARSGDIIFDIVIECRRKPELDPYLFIIIECKDYGSQVPVGDIEEFHTKISQVTGKNVKGMLFSTNSFDRGVLAFGKNTGISVVRMLDDDSLNWFVERTSPYLKTTTDNASQLNVFNALYTENFVSTRKSFFAFDSDQIFESLDKLILFIADSGNQQSPS